MANRFLNNIKINDSYELPPADGTEDQIITTDGAGQLSFVDQSTINAGNAEHVVIYAKNTSGSQINKGTPVYITGTVGATDTVTIAPADAGNSSHMPAVGLLDDTLTNNAFGYVITGGFMDNITTDPIDGDQPASNDTVYVKVGGGLTLTKPIGPGGLIQNIAKVGKVSGGNSGSLIVSSILRTNDIPNLTAGKIWVGTANNTAESTVVHLDETSGRMGINTNSPDTNLEIEQSGTPGIKFNNTAGVFPTFGSITAYSNTTYRGGLTWASTPVQNGARITYVGFPSGVQTTGTFEVGANFVDTSINNGSMVTRLTTTGLGIGTTSPSRTLSVKASSSSMVADFRSNSGNNSFVSFSNNASTADQVRLGSTSGNLVLSTNYTERMRITSTGNVGIGTASPQKLLEVKSITAYNSTLRLQTSAHNWDIQGGETGYSSTAFALDYDGTTFFRAMGITDSRFSGGLSVGTINATPPTGGLYVAGNVGIGTTSPSDKLEVYGGNLIINDGTSKSRLRPSDLYMQQAGVIKAWLRADGNSYLNGGNVGIGTTSPGQKLHVNGNIRVGDSADVVFSNRFYALSNAHVYLVANSGYDLKFYAGGTEKMVVNSSGNVGIGTNSPSQKLDVNGNIQATGTRSISSLFDANNYMRLESNSSGGVLKGTDGGVIKTLVRTYGDSYFNGGNLGIGTTSPNHELVVEGAASPNIELKNSNYSNGGFILNRANYGHQWKWWAESNVMYFGFSTDESTYSTKLAIESSGDVGIGTTSPSYKLDVTGEGRFTGDLRCLSLIQTSQRDQKENINDIDKSKAKAIPFKEYTYKSSIDGLSRKRYGVIAEDIENDYPELVHVGPDGIKGINYIDLLVKRVAELEKELDDVSLTPGPKGDTGATGPQGPVGTNGTNGNDHLKNVQSIAFNQRSGQLEITIEGYKSPFKFNPAK